MCKVEPYNLKKDFRYLQTEIEQRKTLKARLHIFIFGFEKSQTVITKLSRVCVYINSNAESLDQVNIQKYFVTIQEFRACEFTIKRNELSDTLIDKLIAEKEFGTVYIEARIGQLFGNKPILTKGSCSAKIYKDFNGRCIAVFKDGSDEFDPNLLEKIKRFISYIFSIPTQKTFLPITKKPHLSNMLSERAAYVLSKHLELNIVPKTTLVTIDGKKGSFQEFVHGYKEAATVNLPTNKLASKKEKTAFQKFVIFDYLVGNADRTNENYFVKHLSLSFKLIDNGNCFIKSHIPQNLWYFCAYKNQYLWKKESIASSKFTNESLEFIETITPQKINEAIQQLEKEFTNKEFEEFFKDPGVKNGLIDRLNVLKKLDKSHCPKDLAKIRSYESIQSFCFKNASSSFASSY